MPAFTKQYGPWAIVAGGAEGLGEAYAEALARRGINLLLVDNQEASLSTLSRRLTSIYNISVEQLLLDLGGDDAYRRILEEASGLDTGLLIYNAAYSRVRPFTDLNEEDLDLFIRVNTRTPVQLVHGFAKKLIKQKRNGGILLMSSLAGLIGMQLVTPYAATKAFNWNLAEALHHELKDYGIDVMACISGPIATAAFLDTEPEYGMIKPRIMKPGEVAEAALKMLGKKVLYIPGFSNRLNYFILTRLMPRRLAASTANRVMAKLYKKRMPRKNEDLS